MEMKKEKENSCMRPLVITKRLEQELQSCRRYFRKAQIAARQNLQLAQRQERELLYASFSSPRSGASTPVASTAPQPRLKQKRRGEMSKDEQMVSASSDITLSLRQTHDLMASELSRSDFAHNTLKESSKALAELSDTYSSLDTMLSTSRDLLGTLFRSQKSDTWYLETAFFLLVGTIGWLIFRRWLYGPVWWLVWLPLKLVFRSTVGVSSAIGLTGSRVDTDASPLGTQPGLQQAQMNNEGAPSIDVGHHSAGSKESGDPYSMVEQVGKIIDESGDQVSEEDIPRPEKGHETTLRERSENEPPNPKKRMMEDSGADTSQDHHERVKDEL